MKKYTVINQETKELIATEVVLANTFWSRLKGLLGKDNLQETEGLLLSPCNAIHCFGMKFAIDAVFLDEDMKVVHLASNLKPNYKASFKKAKYVLELKAGVVGLKGIQVGDLLELVEKS